VRACVIGVTTLAAIGCPPRARVILLVPVSCADGLPIRVIEDVACPPDGVCGFTCAPGRWDASKG